MIMLLYAVALCVIVPCLIGWIMWRVRWYSRWHGYHPQTAEVYEECVRALHKANK